MFIERWYILLGALADLRNVIPAFVGWLKASIGLGLLLNLKGRLRKEWETFFSQYIWNFYFTALARIVFSPCLELPCKWAVWVFLLCLEKANRKSKDLQFQLKFQGEWREGNLLFTVTVFAIYQHSWLNGTIWAQTFNIKNRSLLNTRKQTNLGKFQADLLVPATKSWCLQRVKAVKSVLFSNKTAGSLQGLRCVLQQLLCSLKISFSRLLPEHINH